MAAGGPASNPRAPDAAAPVCEEQRGCFPPAAAAVVLVLVDGVGDVQGPPGTPLAGLTPLQAAATPVLDAVADTGALGLLDPVEPGRACGSDTAHLSLLGYDPKIFYRGRGAFEAMGAGLAMGPGDIAFKCNFATVVEGEAPNAPPLVTSRRADRDFEADGPPLCAALNYLPIPGFPTLRVAVRYATEHRAGVVLSVKGEESWLSGDVTGTDPLKDGRPLLLCEAGGEGAGGGSGDPLRTAAAVNAVCAAFRSVLADHPVNAARAARGAPLATALLLRGAGVCAPTPPLAGAPGTPWSRAAVLAPTRIIRGLGASLGMVLVECEGGTGDYRTALGAKADAAAAWLLAEKASDAAPDPRPAFLLLHVKAVDDAGHDRDPALKAAWLGAVDAMVGRLVGRLGAAGGGRSFLLAVTGDHSTPAAFGDHSVEPVPFAAAPVGGVVEALGGAEGLLARYGGPARLEPVAVDARAVVRPASFPPGVAFDEAAAACGALGRFPGREMMRLLARMAGGEGVGC